MQSRQSSPPPSYKTRQSQQSVSVLKRTQGDNMRSYSPRPSHFATYPTSHPRMLFTPEDRLTLSKRDIGKPMKQERHVNTRGRSPRSKRHISTND